MPKKVLIANYSVSECFVIPDNINLEDKSQVAGYYVKYLTLYIELTNGEIIEVENQGWIHNNDFKYPSNDETEIDDAYNHGFDEDDEDKNQDNKSKENKCRLIFIFFHINVIEKVFANLLSHRNMKRCYFHEGEGFIRVWCRTIIPNTIHLVA